MQITQSSPVYFFTIAKTVHNSKQTPNALSRVAMPDDLPGMSHLDDIEKVIAELQK